MRQAIEDKLKLALVNVSENKLLDMCKDVGISIDDAIGAANIKYVRIKSSDEIIGLSRDTDRHLYEDRQVRLMCMNTKSIKVYWNGEYYFNKALGLRLRPEWVEVLGLSNNEEITKGP